MSRFCRAVSRITIRKAIDLLVQEGLLYRERAKGTFVKSESDSSDNFTLVKGFTEEMREMGKESRTLHVEVEVIRANKKIAQNLDIDINDKVIVLRRIRGDATKAFAYFITYFKFDDKFSLSADNYYGSFYSYLRNLDILVNQEKEIVEATSPSEEVRKALNIDITEPILKRVRFASCKKQNFYEYTECFYIGKSYKYYLDFTRK